MIQIPNDSGMHGVFGELHGFSGGKVFAEHLEQSVTQHHGAPFRDWLHRITENLPEVTRLALVAMAGALASLDGHRAKFLKRRSAVWLNG
ncbi:hypothetical protein PANNVG_00991 [Pantoea sp. Nvir]